MIYTTQVRMLKSVPRVPIEILHHRICLCHWDAPHVLLCAWCWIYTDSNSTHSPASLYGSRCAYFFATIVSFWLIERVVQNRRCPKCSISNGVDNSNVSESSLSIESAGRIRWCSRHWKWSVDNPFIFIRHSSPMTVFGLIIGASLASFASWPWVLYFTTIVSFILAVVSFILLLPVTMGKASPDLKEYGRFKRLDIFGVSVLTSKSYSVSR